MASTNPPPATPLPPITHILETALYVRDLAASVKFYKEAFNISPFRELPNLAAISLGTTTLLLFQLGATTADVHTPTGTIPAHGPTAPITDSLLSASASTPREHLGQHFCFAVARPEDVQRWDDHLVALGVPISGRMRWEGGGRSVYFVDPDGHVGEVGSKGIWPHFAIEGEY
ncbi:hypothetical protein FQN52_005137 [Onygenales sp. PD_12]|nr:hypothetical protein FQN52_005137 [Onygenales sp. PD_12]KAK2779186.1 hypothetical protein FQN53_001509 [Emmonsiellopsis sp. PD_33]